MRTEVYYGGYPETMQGPLINLIKKIKAKRQARRDAQAVASMPIESTVALPPPPSGIMAFFKNPDGSIKPAAFIIPAGLIAAIIILKNRK